MPAPAGNLARFDWECSRGGTVVLAGVDEAGRGCWAGPVVAAAVVLSPGACPAGLDDSKKIAPTERERLFACIRASALAWGACAVSSVEIDRINILAATLVAMGRAVRKLAVAPHLVLVDGLQTPPLPCEARAVVKGDGTSASIAAASIVAKVLRDRVMVAWDRRFPDYGFAAHKGYGAPVHRAALTRLGPCPLHRRSYQPVARWNQPALWHDPR